MRDYRTFQEKDHLASWDLVDKDGKPRDFTLIMGEIDGVVLKTRDTPKGKRRMVIRLRGAQKAFVCNITNGDTIASMYGPDVDKWVGKPITIYQTMVRSPKGGTIPGIRVRPKVPTGKVDAEIASQPVNEVMRAEQDAAFGREPGEEG